MHTLVDKFNKQDTNFLKGIAIILLLFHHLFYEHPEIGSIKYRGLSLVFISALAAKVCVSIFLILSGYGLNETVRGKAIGLKKFYLS